MGRHEFRIILLLPLLALVGLLTGCATAVARHAPPPVETCGSIDPIQVVVGVTTWRSSDPKLATALRTVIGQLSRRALVPGSPGIDLSVFPLTEDSLAEDAFRVRTPCIPHPPERPDRTTVGAFGHQTAAADYQAQLNRSQRAQTRAKHAVEAFGKRVQQHRWPDSPPSVWGFLTLASRELATRGGNERFVVIVSPDESDDERSTARNNCHGCSPLEGATVVWLNFDAATPADQRRRSWEWACWLTHEDAGSVLFYRSNERIPPLFGPVPPHAPWSPTEFADQKCYR